MSIAKFLRVSEEQYAADQALPDALTIDEVPLPRRAEPLVAVKSEEDFFRVAQAGFALRRKTMTNGLCAAFHMDRAEAVALMQAAGLDERIRGEKLGFEELARLSDAYTDWKAGQA